MGTIFTCLILFPLTTFFRNGVDIISCIKNEYYLLIEYFRQSKNKFMKKTCFNSKLVIDNEYNYNLLIDIKTILSNYSINDLNVLDIKYNNVKIYLKSFVDKMHLLGWRDFNIIDIVQVPCGKCSECLKRKSKDISARLYLELLNNIDNNNYFITLTYNEIYNPGVLVKNEISKFNKKLRTYLDRLGLDSSFKFYAVGEYGDKFKRPHYHIIYFNLNLPDCIINLDKAIKSKFKSDFLENVWSKGFISIDSVELGSICYVARYCDKKQILTFEEKKKFIDMGLVPEFSISSKKLGFSHFDKLLDNVKNNIPFINIKGVNYALPKYFLKKAKEFSLELSKSNIINIDFNDYYNKLNNDYQVLKNKKNKRKLL